MITGTMALVGSAHLLFAMTAQQTGAASGMPAAVHLPEKPKDLLCSNFRPELLRKSLLSVSEWHPYESQSRRD